MFNIADAIKSVGEAFIPSPTRHTGLIKSLSEAFTSLFNYFKTAKECQSETELIKDKHKAEEANNIAEKIFLLVDVCRYGFSNDEWKKYLELKKKFNNKD